MNFFGKNALDLFFWPIYGSIFLIMWTMLVYPWSKYGDYWAILPAALVFPTVLGLHILLIFKNGWQMKLVCYGVAHLIFLFLISIICFMLISKDSL